MVGIRGILGITGRAWHAAGWDERDFRDERDREDRDFRDYRGVACRLPLGHQGVFTFPMSIKMESMKSRAVGLPWLAPRTEKIWGNMFLSWDVSMASPGKLLVEPSNCSQEL